MACTIFYKGNLKNESTFQDIVAVVNKHSVELDCTVSVHESMIDLRLNSGRSEPLILEIENGRLDGFCKWNGDNEKEYYKLLDIFIDLKPLFKSLNVEDDCGIWYSYLSRSKPCKIVIRTELTKQEEILLQRMIHNNNVALPTFEQEILSAMFREKFLFAPRCSSIIRIILQDFIKVCDIKSLNTEERTKILTIAKGLKGFIDYFTFTEHNFPWEFKNITVAVWIDYCLSYKNSGIVHEINHELRGLTGNKLAGMFGIVSGFMNSHSGHVNAKHAEIDRFLERNNMYDRMCKPSVSTESTREDLELLVSVLDYLGFKYEGTIIHAG